MAHLAQLQDYDWPQLQLFDSALDGSLAQLHAALAAGADPNARCDGGETPLYLAVTRSNLAAVEALLQAGADPNVPDEWGSTPLHEAAMDDDVQSISALLAAGADPAALTAAGYTTLHAAASLSCTAAVRALLAAAPQLALHKQSGQLPLERALQSYHDDAARCLLVHAPVLPTSELLASLEAAARRWPRGPAFGRLHSLYAPLVARQPLTPAEWARVPRPCTGLGAALPEVLARSEAEAAALVAHLPLRRRQRLRTTALCLHRIECMHGLELPPALQRPLLLAAVVE